MLDPKRAFSRDDIETTILNKVAQISVPKRDLSSITITDSLSRDLNIDSLGFIELIIEIENSFDLTFEDDYLLIDEYPDVKALIDYAAKVAGLE